MKKTLLLASILAFSTAFAAAPAFAPKTFEAATEASAVDALYWGAEFIGTAQGDRNHDVYINLSEVVRAGDVNVTPVFVDPMECDTTHCTPKLYGKAFAPEVKAFDGGTLLTWNTGMWQAENEFDGLKLEFLVRTGDSYRIWRED